MSILPVPLTISRGLLLTAVGVLTLVGLLTCGLVLWHLYTDHVAFHAVLEYLNQHAGAINKLP